MTSLTFYLGILNLHLFGIQAHIKIDFYVYVNHSNVMLIRKQLAELVITLFIISCLRYGILKLI